MLTYMRKNAKSWIIIIPIGIIIVVFIFFYGFSDVRKRNDLEVVASVGDKKITMAEYTKSYKNMLEFYRSIYRGQFNDEMAEQMGLKQRVLEQLIDREVLLREARKQSILVDTEEIRSAIINTPAFQENGVFSQERYQRILSYYGMTASDYEKDKEKELVLKAFQNRIVSAVKVSEKEIRDTFTTRNESATIEIARLSPEKVSPNVTVTDEEISVYYDNNKEDFRVPEKIKTRYIVFDPEGFEDKITVSDEEIREFYEADPEQFFEPEKRKARHILFKLESKSEKKEQESVRREAEKVLARVQAGEDFDVLARKHSDDAASADKGGDLGFFARGEMVKPFEEAAFSLKPGETSGLVRSQYGFHIIRVEDVLEARIKPLDEVAGTIRKDLKKEQAVDLVRKEARRAFNRLFKSRDLQGYAENNDLALMTTDFFAYGEAPDDRKGKERFSKETFPLAVGDLTPAFSIGEKYYLAKVVDRKDSHIEALDAATTAVRKTLTKTKRLQQARKKAEDLLASLQGGEKTLQEVAGALGAELKEVEFKRTGEYVPDMGNAPEVKKAVFALNGEDRFAPEVFQTERGMFIVRLVKKTEPEKDAFLKEKDALRRSIKQRKQEEIFSQFLQKLKEGSEIRINRELFTAA